MFNLKPSNYVRTADLILTQEKRQRIDHDVTDILPSIKARGIYNPIIVDEDYNIVAGARRWLAAQEAGMLEVPVRLVTDLSPIEKKIVELEENFYRKDLTWKETANALYEIHQLYSVGNPNWTAQQTSDMTGFKPSLASMNITVAKAMENGHKQVIEASGLRAAYNFISRQQMRKIEDAMADIEELVAGEHEEKAPPEDERRGVPATVHSGSTNIPRGTSPAGTGVTPATESILNADFLEWGPAYTEKPFNLIHCDFPYGVNIDKSDQANSETWGTYEDSPEIYWELLACLLKNRKKLMSTESHILFWLSADLQTFYDTISFFRLEASDIELWRTPLVWHKTDNRGIIADAQRGPRHVYEICLLGSRGDRKIVKSVSDTYGAPTAKAFHHSTKTEPMLKHFLSMLVDDTTRMLDPTCGSGSALRAAEALGARMVLGLEKNPEFVELAQAELRRFRILRNASV